MNRVVIGIGVAVGIIVLAVIILASIFGWWAVLRDVAICLTALVSLLLLAFLGTAVFYLTVTLINIKRELMPVLESLKSTSQTVSQTARVASDLGVSPTVRTASVLVGAAETAAIVLGRGHARSRAQKRARRKQEVERELLARGELDGNL